MTTLQLNAEMLRLMSIVAEDENMLKRAVKYLKTLVSKREDPTLMSREEFFAQVDFARQQIRDGKGVRMHHGETLTQLLERTGHAVRN